MTKKQFIQRFHLIKTNTKCCFYDGTIQLCRTLYIDKKNNFYVFYNNDLHTVTLYLPSAYEDDIKEVDGKLGAGYSWYH